MEHSLTKIAGAIEGKLQHASHIFHRLGLAGETMLAGVREQLAAVEFAARSLKSLNPLTLLRRGYSIVFKDGKVVQRAGVLKTGEEIEVRLGEGEIWSRVTRTSEGGQLKII